MTSKRNQTVLITGASGGIGYELVKVFAQEGYDLVLVARSKDKLNEIAQELSSKHGIKAYVIPHDLTSPQASTHLYHQVKELNIQVDILINNAGFGTYGLFHEADVRSQEEMIQLNITVLTQLTHLFLKDMVQNKFGRILNVASTAAFQPGPLMSVYYASKGYVLYFSEGLDKELEASGVRVCVLCPGPTKTGFQKRARLQSGNLLTSMAVESHGVAWAGYRGLMAGKRVIIPGFLNKLMVFFVRFFPRWAVTEIVYKVQQTKTKI